MEDLSLHILDVAENSIYAGAHRIEIKILEDLKKDILSLEIKDNGRGMSEEVLKKVTDPFYTTRTTRDIGLGLSLLSQSAKEAEGDMVVSSKVGMGTSVYAYFKHSHIDRKPLGNIVDTIIVLIVGNPEIDFLYEHRKNDKLYSLDTAEIKAALEGIPLTTPEVVETIRKNLQEGLKEIGA